MRLEEWKATAGPELAAAIGAVARGEATLYQAKLVEEWHARTIAEADPRDVERLLAAIYRPPKPLTEGEADVLKLASEGYDLQMTADVLHISKDAVVSRRSKAFRKLRARNISEAVAKWLKSAS